MTKNKEELLDRLNELLEIVRLDFDTDAFAEAQEIVEKIKQVEKDE